MSQEKCTPFIVFEGLDGSGKSSLMVFLEQQLKTMGVPYIKTREPGGTELGESLRSLLLQKKEPPPSPRTELLLYEASRSQHVFEVIQPALQQKKWVLCDRYTASSVAFQGGGRELSESDVEALNTFATQGLVANLTVLLDLPVSIAKQRRQQRQLQFSGVEEDRMEAEEEVFHERVRQSFLRQAQKNPQRWLVLSAQESPDVLAQRLLQHLELLQWL